MVTIACLLLVTAAQAAAVPSPALAQHFSVGMKAGVATLEPISVNGIFQRVLHPAVWGPVGEVVLPRNFSIEASALHRQIAYRWRFPLSFNSTSFPPVVEQRQKE